MGLLTGSGLGNGFIVFASAIGPPTTFDFQVTTTAAAQTYSWAVSSGTVTSTADWGDGSAVESFTAPATYSHTYASAGTYVVKVAVGAGANVGVNFRPLTDRTRITKLLSAFPAWPNINTMLNCFNGCSGITGTIPTDLLRYVTASGSFASFFSACSGLTGSIPVDLLRYVTPSTLNSFFSGCSGLTGSIPTDHLRYSTTSTLANHFTGCSGLTGSIPADLLRYTTSVTAINAMFQSCSGLTGQVPIDFLRYVTAVVNMSSIFNACTRLQLQADIFGPSASTTRFLNKSVNFTNAFNNMGTFSGTPQGTAPDLWNFSYGTGTPTSTNTFSGNGASLSNWASIPIAWGGPA